MDFDDILIAAFNFTTPYLCALLCFAPFRDRLRRPYWKIAAGAALLCGVFALTAAALRMFFEFDRSGNFFMFLFIPLFFLYYYKNTAEDLQKLLFVFCMANHASSIMGGIVLAIRVFTDELTAGSAYTSAFVKSLIILLIIAYYFVIRRIVDRAVTPRLRRIDPQGMKRLWIVPVMLASIPIFLYTFYPMQSGVNYLVLAIFIPVSVVSFAVYGLILGMLDNVMESARAKEESLALERTNRLKSELMSTISHEARTPLAVLASYAGLVSMELKDKGAETQAAAADLDRIVFEAKRVAELIDSMNKLTLSGECAAKRISLDIGDAIRRTAGLYRHLLESDGTEFEIRIEDGLPEIFGSPEELTQALFNLLQNARKATAATAASGGAVESGEGRVESGRPLITIKAEKTIDNSPLSTFNSQLVKVTVSDNGTGIPEGLLHRVFERGVSGFGSTGLGLPITKEIIESHGGEIRVESGGLRVESEKENNPQLSTLNSPLANGTTVIFTLPIYEGER